MKTLITQISPTIHPIDTTKMFYFIVQVESLKQLPQLCNNSSDLSHPQNCILIEKFHSQWSIVATTKTLGSTMHINKYQHQQQIWMPRMKPRMPIYSFSSIDWPPSRTSQITF